MRLELTKSAKDTLDKLTELTGMTQVALMSRLVEWFTQQPELIQAAVLGGYPKEVHAELAQLIFHRMYKKPLTTESIKATRVQQ